MNSASSKTELRKQISEEITVLPEDYIEDSDRGIFLRVVSLSAFVNARNVMIYHSVRREPDTLNIVKTALLMGKTVSFPYCLKGGIMQARAVKSLNELKPAMLGIPAPPDTAPIIAPEELEIVIVPALAYDLTGNRIGYGGGYYDRYLSGIPAFTVGMTRERLIKRELPVEPHDIAVKCVVTEERIFAQR